MQNKALHQRLTHHDSYIYTYYSRITISPICCSSSTIAAMKLHKYTLNLVRTYHCQLEWPSRTPVHTDMVCAKWPEEGPAPLCDLLENDHHISQSSYRYAQLLYCIPARTRRPFIVYYLVHLDHGHTYPLHILHHLEHSLESQSQVHVCTSVHFSPLLHDSPGYGTPSTTILRRHFMECISCPTSS